MKDDYWSFMRYIGLGLGYTAAAAVVITIYVGIREEFDRRRDARKYYQRIEERLNDVEVWHEETAPEVQFLRDRTTNLEQKERAMGEYYQLVSSWPLIGGLIIVAVYFIVRGAKKHGDR